MVDISGDRTNPYQQQIDQRKRFAASITDMNDGELPGWFADIRISTNTANKTSGQTVPTGGAGKGNKVVD